MKFYKYITVALFSTIFSFQLYAQKANSTKADSLFSLSKYREAIIYYEKLTDQYPKDPKFNYHLGVCYLKLNSQIDIARKALATAATSEDSPAEVYFYLGELYHKTYNFEKAIKYYERYIQNTDTENNTKYNPQKRITECDNASYLLEYIHKVNITNSQAGNFHQIHQLQKDLPENYRFIEKPAELNSKADNEKPFFTIINFPKNINTGDKILYTSYGENKNGNKDIFQITRLEDGTWAQPEALSSIINTAFDEDFPVLSADGTTLYFASKGHYSMGGYDIYKSNFNVGTNTWSTPENLDFPINTPYDDILYIELSDQKHASFASNRNTEAGTFTVYTYEINERPIQKTPKDIEEIRLYSNLQITKSPVKIPEAFTKEEQKEIDFAKPEFKQATSEKSEYDILLDQALNLQLKADSVNRLIDLYRKNLTNETGVKKRNTEQQIVELEAQAYKTQKQADDVYIKVREYEQNNFAELEASKAKTATKTDVKELYNNISFAEFTGSPESKKQINNALNQLKALDQSKSELNDLIAEIYASNGSDSEQASYTKQIKTYYQNGIDYCNTIIDASNKLISGFSLKLNKAEVTNQPVKTNIERANTQKFNAKLISNNIPETDLIAHYNSKLEVASIYLNAIYLYEVAIALHINITPPKEEDFNLYNEFSLQYPLEISISKPAIVDNSQSDTLATDSIPQEQDFTEIVFEKQEPEFEIRTDNYYTSKNPILINQELPEKLIYRVQLGAFSSKKKPALFKGMYPITADKKSNSKIIIYYAGLFKTYDNAKANLASIRKKGFKDAYIVPFWHGKRTSLKRAKMLEAPIDKPINNKQKTSSNKTKENKQYRIKIQVKEYITSQMLSQVREIAKNKDLTRSRKNTGEIVYSIGNFNTFEQAEFVRNDLIKLGLKQVFISEVNISIK